MHKNKELILQAQRIRALAQTGLTYSSNEYDIERYTELLDISNRITATVADLEPEAIDNCYLLQKEYVTPKVDIRAVVFNDKGEILLVRERLDGNWSLPGGWADVGYSPKEVVVKEVKEETGLDVSASRLLAVMDMSRHNHPSIPFYVYKFFILCEVTGGGFSEAFDILDKGFFDIHQLPELSLERVLPEQIRQMAELRGNGDRGVYLD
ncbi:NUDIX hydrolase [Parabacteroides sp. OttesenSCG-928-N08]|nr:NUDIX hydrolase [Parabacteroides sp. OttesenSCG-928-N08]